MSREGHANIKVILLTNLGNSLYDLNFYLYDTLLDSV